MNQSKLKYARERLNTLVSEAISKVSPDYENELDYTDAAKKLASGTNMIQWDRFLPHMNRSSYDLRKFISEQFDDIIAEENAAIEERNQKLCDAFNIVRDEIIAHKIKVEDELVLGDEAKALELLAAFSASY